MRKNLLISILILFVISNNSRLQGIGDPYALNSVLSSGKWLKIAVTAEGIYRLDYSLLKQKGLTDPSNPRIFSNNTGQLSYYNDGSAPDDLKEIAIYLNTGNDGVFNEGDYLLFYGMGTHRWKFDEPSDEYVFVRHNYSDTAFYFITSGSQQGKKIEAYHEPASSAAFNSNSSDALFYHEVEFQNLITSGRDWFESVVLSTGIRINPVFNGLITSEKLKISVRVAARSSTASGFSLLEGNAVRKEIVMPSLNIFNTTGIHAAIADSAWSLNVNTASPQFELQYNNKGNSGAAGWLDYFRIQGRVRNIFNGQLTTIMDSRSVSPGMVTSFTVESQTDNPLIWDVTDPFTTRSINYTLSGKNINFKSRTDSLRKFVVFLPSNAIVPDIRSAIVPNQNLHASPAADMIIITYPGFRNYADELAGIHFDNSGLVSQVVTTTEVYNEFSGGIPDIAGLRNFIRMKFMKQRGTSKPLKYLLLFGDGSVENKALPPGNPNFVPTYQSKNSNVVVSSYTSDDFYSLLEDGEGESEGTEDIGVGRLPVNNAEQASVIINKIRKYLDPANMGDWRNVITLTADDEDGNAHMIDAEGLDLVLKQEAPEYNVEKIYLDAFRQSTSVNGQSYPDATLAINGRINEGCLIFNYTGHGNERFLASEMVIRSEDFFSWRNGGKLPLFITATCEFSRFDDVVINSLREISQNTSAGEKVLFAPDGGAIALMSTTRVVFSSPNFFLNRNIFSCAFDRDSAGNPMRFGDIIRIAKNNSGTGSNKRNFSLLGDPALRLAYPWHGKVITDSINHVPVSTATDSLKALSMITISGHIETPGGLFMNDFEGVVSPLVFDKESRIKTLGNDGSPVMQFGMRNNILFKGRTKVREGRFTLSFIVPRDIDYSFGKGKISYYATDSTRDMNGVYTDAIVGGFTKSTTTDMKGPQIRLYMNDTLFRSGGITDDHPVLLAVIEDTGGINITGAGIGHDLTGFLDNDRNTTLVLNSYYINDFDNYSKGRVEYSLPKLTPGPHTFTLKAWDYYNNSAEKSIDFIVETDKKFTLKNLFNYPNPVINGTSITGQINRPDEHLGISIVISSLNGKIIKSINSSVSVAGYVLPPVEWDGCDANGNRVAKGMYLYIVTVTTSKQEISRASGKLIIL